MTESGLFKHPLRLPEPIGSLLDNAGTGKPDLLNGVPT